MMDVKPVLLFLLLLLNQALFANKETPLGPQPTDSNIGCELLPPNTLDVNSVGANWVNLSWPAAPGADQYRIQVIRDATGAVLSTTFVPSATLSAQVPANDSNGDRCHAEIWSVCPDGSFNKVMKTNSGPFWPIIIELIGNALTPTAFGGTSCNLATNPTMGCSFDWVLNQKTYFIMKYTPPGGTLVSNQFAVYPVAGASPGQQNVRAEYEKNSNGLSLAFGPSEYSFYVRYNNSAIATLSVMHPITPGSLTIPGYVYIDGTPLPNAVFEKIIASSAATPDNRAAETEATLSASAFPNPFTDVLAVPLPSDNSGSSTVRLYDILGNLQRNYVADPGQTELRFNTTDLPSGVYFLQLECGGKVVSQKVYHQ